MFLKNCPTENICFLKFIESKEIDFLNIIIGSENTKYSTGIAILPWVAFFPSFTIYFLPIEMYKMLKKQDIYSKCHWVYSNKTFYAFNILL